ncbi:MAG: trypsin-like peptidase domain-containing protein, partial [Phycisphaerales bacterium]|nr:trypsin-like peptidase domain-containing protein [Phycisphaerales bacterium]
MKSIIRPRNSNLTRCVAVIGLALLSLSPAVNAQLPGRYTLGDLKALERSFVDLAEKARSAVVAVRAYQVRTLGEDESKVKVPISQGSGFIIDPNGFIATNGHVVENADRVTVVLSDGSQFDAVVRQRDDRSDLAVLKIEADNLPVVHWGDASALRANQWVFACGNPFGMANRNGQASITYGVVSALGRDMTDRITENPQLHYYGNLIETSATINPGSSGGPLFNVDGQIVGIVTAIETSSGVNEGMGFAIPVDANTRRILDTLKGGQAVRYG